MGFGCGCVSQDKQQSLKANQVIKYLQHLVSKYGDLDVTIMQEFLIEDKKMFTQIESKVSDVSSDGEKITIIGHEM